ncbi:MAG: hypothetical protein WCY75_08850 [Sulfurimonadaceae bacterium]|jgi:hypothetical protein|nr:hypothetical protein [Arcobacteraceae bacterium]MDX9796652.1 hypothetical protein [Arcobacteraceae bacterium]
MRKDIIKVKLLRDIKTDALMIYIRSVLEEIVSKIDKNEYSINLGYKEFNDEIRNNVLFLLAKLQQNVLNANELKNIIIIEQNKRSNTRLLPDDEALILYFNTLVKEIETILNDGQPWIPEQVIFALLSEWVIEENKSTYFYPFLNEIDYLKLLNYYEQIAKEEIETDIKSNVLKMYNIASRMIQKLKNCKYKINRRKSKQRVKK